MDGDTGYRTSSTGTECEGNLGFKRPCQTDTQITQHYSGTNVVGFVYLFGLGFYDGRGGVLRCGAGASLVNGATLMELNAELISPYMVLLRCSILT